MYDRPHGNWCECGKSRMTRVLFVLEHKHKQINNFEIWVYVVGNEKEDERWRQLTFGMSSICQNGASLYKMLNNVNVLKTNFFVLGFFELTIFFKIKM